MHQLLHAQGQSARPGPRRRAWWRRRYRTAPVTALGSAADCGGLGRPAQRRQLPLRLSHWSRHCTPGPPRPAGPGHRVATSVVVRVSRLRRLGAVKSTWGPNMWPRCCLCCWLTVGLTNSSASWPHSEGRPLTPAAARCGRVSSVHPGPCARAQSQHREAPQAAQLSVEGAGAALAGEGAAAADLKPAARAALHALAAGALVMAGRALGGALGPHRMRVREVAPAAGTPAWGPAQTARSGGHHRAPLHMNVPAIGKPLRGGGPPPSIFTTPPITSAPSLLG